LAIKEDLFCRNQKRVPPIYLFNIKASLFIDITITISEKQCQHITKKIFIAFICMKLLFVL